MKVTRVATDLGTVSITGTASNPDTTGAVKVELFEAARLLATTSTNPRTHTFTFTHNATNTRHTYTVEVLNRGAGTGPTKLRVTV